ncbi:MAG: hypothetical protein ACR2K0_04285 [Acidimicrobiales bacterium]
MGHTNASTTTPAPQRRGLRLSEMLTIRDETDENGRLLLEDSAPKQARKKAGRGGIAMRSVPCSYTETPSRDGGLMNVSAYEALRHDTAEILSGFAWFTRSYLARSSMPPATLQGLVDVSNLGISLPLVLFRSGRDPVPLHGALPSYVASMFKASRGVFSAAIDMLNTLGPTSTTTGAEVVRFADREGHLIRPQTRRACAAPTRLMERTIDVILTGGDDVAAEQTDLEELISFDRLWDFYSMEHSFSQAFSRYSAALQGVRQGAETADRGDLFAETIVDDGRRWSFGDFTDAFLEFANSVQDGLNRLLGRADNAPPVVFEDLVRIL